MAEELALCEKKPKKAKRKQKQRYIQQLPALDNIPEEASSSTTSSHAILEICQNAAVTVLADSMLKAIQLSINSSHEQLITDAEQTEYTESPNKSELTSNQLNDSVFPKPEEIFREIGTYEAVHESKLSTEYKPEVKQTTSDDTDMQKLLNDVAFEDKSEPKFNSSKADLLLDGEVSSEHLSLVDSPASLTQTSSVENAVGENRYDEKELSSKLKPSVFVGKGKLYSSSLQIGCHWDRTKYNIVLLPELNKVVYPDLDALLYNKPSSNPFYSHGHTPRQDNNRLIPPAIAVDRSCKPRGVENFSKTENGDTLGHTTKVTQLVNATCAVAIIPPTNVIEKPNANTNYTIDTNQDYRFTDCKVGGVDFRVFMNPIKWFPVDNCQLVIYRVGPLYYEEYFVNCKTTDGLINAIKERAASWEHHQLTLAQTCLLTNAEDAHFIEMPNSKTTLVIYGCPTHWKTDWQIIRFGVNDAFYQESLQGCNSFNDVVKIIKNRADIIDKEQRILKAKAYSTSPAKENLRIESVQREALNSKNSDAMMDIYNYDFDDERDRIESIPNRSTDLNQTHDNDLNAVTLTGHADQTRKGNSIKNKFKSFRKWVKGTFSKKADKAGSTTAPQNLNNSRGTASQEIIWQHRNDSPAALHSTGSTNVLPYTHEL